MQIPSLPKRISSSFKRETKLHGRETPGTQVETSRSAHRFLVPLGSAECLRGCQFSEEGVFRDPPKEDMQQLKHLTESPMENTAQNNDMTLCFEGINKPGRAKLSIHRHHRSE